MTKKVLVLVEGPTEEAFIKHVVAPALPGIALIPTVVKTKATGAQPEKGGFVKYGEFKRQLNLLLRDPSASVVTTMLDYQGIGSDFPGWTAPGVRSGVVRADVIEMAMKSEIADNRYFPNLTLHEFEALLFVQPKIIAEVLQDLRLAKPLQAIRDRYPKTPEEINDSAATSPSARIESTCADICGSPRVFRKRTHGPIIAGRIGLAQIREACPHFDAWLKKLEAVASVQP